VIPSCSKDAPSCLSSRFLTRRFFRRTGTTATSLLVSCGTLSSTEGIMN
jgi:hypothetical protein